MKGVTDSDLRTQSTASCGRSAVQGLRNFRRLPPLTVAVVAVLLTLLASVSPAAASWDSSPCVWGKPEVTVRAHGNYSRWKLQEAIREWNAVSAGQPKFRMVTDGTADVTIRKISDRSVPYDGTKYHRCSGPDIYDSQVRINTVWNTTALTREYVMLHELGHALGLGHSFDEESVMCYCYPYSTRHAAPTAADADRLSALYEAMT